MSSSNPKEFDELVKNITGDLIRQGKLIQAGFASLELIALHELTPSQRAAARMAFFAGAQHLFGSIMSILDPGEEPTDKDLQRMGQIERELEEFAREFKQQHTGAR